MNRKIRSKLVIAQLCYFGGLSVSILLTRGGFTHNHGLSFYGEHLRTLLPYGAGTIGCCWLTVRAAADIPGRQDPYRLMRVSLRTLAALLVLLLATPDTFGEFLNVSHEVVAFMLFSGELGLAIWLAFRWCPDMVTRLLAAGQLAAGLAAMFSEFNILRYLSASSLLFQICFCTLLVRAIGMLPPPGEPPALQSAGGSSGPTRRSSA